MALQNKTMNKTIFFLIDGLADKIRNNTPLKLAKKQNINKLLPYSFLAKFFPLKKNEWPKTGYASVSQYANLAILGYDIKNLYLKRGPIEAIGSESDADLRGLNSDRRGINYQDGWLAIRFNFGSVNEKMRVIDRRAGRSIFGLDELAQDLQKINFEIPFIIKRTYGHRGALIFKQKLSDKISNSDPLKISKKILKIKPLAKDGLSQKTARIVQKFIDIASVKLKEHPVNQQRIKNGLLPVNCLLLREAGNQLPNLSNASLINSNLSRTRNRLVVAENGVIKGTCKLAGFETLTVPEMDLEEQMNFIFDAVKKNSQTYDLIYSHIKGADEAAHDKNCKKKKGVIEAFDKCFSNLITAMEIENFTYIITGDHITDCQTGQHEFGAVPILFINKNIESNNPKEFSEISAREEIKNIWN
jgi:2,3-bisphosphoglycerate-independent phosphoglycerate mutase